MAQALGENEIVRDYTNLLQKYTGIEETGNIITNGLTLGTALYQAITKLIMKKPSADRFAKVIYKTLATYFLASNVQHMITAKKYLNLWKETMARYPENPDVTFNDRRLNMFIDDIKQDFKDNVSTTFFMLLKYYMGYMALIFILIARNRNIKRLRALIVLASISFGLALATTIFTSGIFLYQGLLKFEGHIKYLTRQLINPAAPFLGQQIFQILGLLGQLPIFEQLPGLQERKTERLAVWRMTAAANPPSADTRCFICLEEPPREPGKCPTCNTYACTAGVGDTPPCLQDWWERSGKTSCPVCRRTGYGSTGMSFGRKRHKRRSRKSRRSRKVRSRSRKSRRSKKRE
jgi:hypothetical protein